MIAFRGCPRCGGDVLQFLPSDNERAICINCGWRQPEITEEVRAQVEAHLGKQNIEDSYRRHRVKKKAG